MFVVKCEIVHVEDDPYEVTNSFRGDELIVACAAKSVKIATIRSELIFFKAFLL